MFTILLIDDEEDLLEICQAIIQIDVECNFITARSGFEAAEKIKNHPEIDIIISDYNMKDGNGAYVYAQVKDKNKYPFCLLTGGYLDDYKDLTDFNPSENKKHFVLNKPVDEVKLVETVKKMEALITR